MPKGNLWSLLPVCICWGLQLGCGGNTGQDSPANAPGCPVERAERYAVALDLIDRGTPGCVPSVLWEAWGDLLPVGCSATAAPAGEGCAIVLDLDCQDPLGHSWTGSLPLEFDSEGLGRGVWTLTAPDSYCSGDYSALYVPLPVQD